MQITTGGRILNTVAGLMGVAFVILGSWFNLFPPPNPVSFTSKVGDILTIIMGSMMATWSIMMFLRARKKTKKSPEKFIQLAYADLVNQVFLDLRNGVFKDRDQLFNLGDALHNVSGILGDYGAWIEDQKYRELYLRPYDKKWGSKGLVLESFLVKRIEFHSKT